MKRDYRGFMIYRHGEEKTLTIWKDGRCLESGLPGMIAAKNWINKRNAQTCGDCNSNACETYQDAE